MKVVKVTARLLDHPCQFLDLLDQVVCVDGAAHDHETSQEGEPPGSLILGEDLDEAVYHVGVSVNEDRLEVQVDCADVLAEEDSDDPVQLVVHQLTLGVDAAVEELPGRGAAEPPLVRRGRDDGLQQVSQDKCWQILPQIPG